MANKQDKQSVMTARRRREGERKRNSRRSSRERREATRRHNPFWLIGGLVLAVLLIVGIFIYLSDNQPIAAVIGPTDPSVLQGVSHVKPSVFAEVGADSVQNQFKTTGNTTVWTGKDGKPEIFYYGAEFCPYCAAQRWSLAIALSRFGTFSQLPLTRSSSQDVYPNTATLTFVQSQYKSSLIDFVPVEARDRDGNTLQTPAPHEQPILNRYHVTGFPFINVTDQYLAVNPFYLPDVLQGLSQNDIASKLTNPNDDVTKHIIAGANYITAAICLATHNQPTSVCTQASIPALAQTVMHSPNWRQQQSQP